MNYVLNRNYTLITTKGRSIHFVKGVPTHVPPNMVRDVVALGATPEDGSDPNIELEPNVKQAPQDPTVRLPAIRKAVLAVVERGEREDFTGAGHPHEKAVSKEAGFRVASKEVAQVWQQLADEAAADADNK